MYPLIHIGYHKAASSWLQRNLFPDADCGFQLPFGHRNDIEKHFVFPHPLDFDPERVTSQYKPELERLFSAGFVPVISHERLSGNPHSGGYDSTEVAMRLHQTLPDA